MAVRKQHEIRRQSLEAIDLCGDAKEINLLSAPHFNHDDSERLAGRGGLAKDRGR
jgi:hypothetical protein